MCDATVREKQAATMYRKYQARHALQARRFIDKMTATNLARYGVRNVMQSAHSFACMEKYGVSSPMQCKQIVDKMMATKLQNHTINTSATEDILYDQLCDVFGKDDVIRQYKSCRYDWNCDFYVKSRDMFIELNASFFHNRHWFDDANSNDCAEFSSFMAKAALDSNSSYSGVVQTWSVYDVRKRQDARDANLNYIVFWDNDLRDAAVWFAMGCPDGQDWCHEYSWLSERDIRGIDLNTLPALSSNPANLSLIAKAYQFHVFYAREEQLWRDNRRVRKNLPVQLFLYYNRLRYKNFVPDRVSDLQLMRAFTVSGVFKGYTVFDSRLMDLAVSKYNIKSIYDPCAGWGERGLYCKSRDMKYLGVDINHALFAGYDKMRQEYNMQEQQFVESDSASVALFDNYDAVLTCPPYGSTEIYSPNGSENLDDFDFLNWWRDVVRNSLSVNPRYFCFQINQKWRDSMISVTQEFNLRLIDELFYNTSRVSHLNRKPGGVKLKREFESMLIFEIY